MQEVICDSIIGLRQRAAWGWGQRENRGNCGKSVLMGTELTVIPQGWGQTPR